MHSLDLINPSICSLTVSLYGSCSTFDHRECCLSMFWDSFPVPAWINIVYKVWYRWTNVWLIAYKIIKKLSSSSLRIAFLRFKIWWDFGRFQFCDGFIFQKEGVEVIDPFVGLIFDVFLLFVFSSQGWYFFLFLFLQFLRQGVTFFAGEDVLRHSDSKLIILIFLHNIDFGFLLVKNLFLFIDPFQIVFFLFLNHLFVLCSHEIVSEFAVVDVDEVNDVDDEHGHADDQCG